MVDFTKGVQGGDGQRKGGKEGKERKEGVYEYVITGAEVEEARSQIESGTGLSGRVSQGLAPRGEAGELENMRIGSIGFYGFRLDFIGWDWFGVRRIGGTMLGKTSLFINCIGVCWNRVT